MIKCNKTKFNIKSKTNGNIIRSENKMRIDITKTTSLIFHKQIKEEKRKISEKKIKIL